MALGYGVFGGLLFWALPYGMGLLALALQASELASASAARGSRWVVSWAPGRAARRAVLCLGIAFCGVSAMAGLGYESSPGLWLGWALGAWGGVAVHIATERYTRPRRFSVYSGVSGVAWSNGPVPPI